MSGRSSSGLLLLLIAVLGFSIFLTQGSLDGFLAYLFSAGATPTPAPGATSTSTRTAAGERRTTGSVA